MFRLWFMVVLCAFIALVGWGVQQTAEQFNRMVRPSEPVKAFAVQRTKEDQMQIEIAGEKMVIDQGTIENKLAASLDQMEQKWSEFRDSARLNGALAAVVGETRKQWEQLMASERVQAVNLWVRERI